MGPIHGIAIHHSVTTGNAAWGEAEELGHIQTIDRYHVQIEYGGFGYHLAAFPSGRSYLCGDLAGQRAHVASRNHELIGIVAIGNFVGGLPAPPQMNAIMDCITYTRQVVGVHPVKGHNEWALPGQGTACAGALNGYQWGTPIPPVPPTVDLPRLAHSVPFLYAAAYKNDRTLLHPTDAGEIQKALDWHKAG